MKKALVFGGTKFFGIHLVNQLLDKGFHVTIATRGKTPDPFGESVRRVEVDRTDKQSLSRAFKYETWDVIYDQICFSSQDAMTAMEIFKGKTYKYIFTSSLSVYDMEKSTPPVTEEDFDPTKEKLVVAGSDAFSYQEGKQQAEAAFFQHAPFPVTTVRFPIVLGENDYTGRLALYIKKIKYRQGVYIDNPQAEMNFISEQEAGQFLAWLADMHIAEPLNACTNGSVSLEQLLNQIAETTGQSVIYSDKQSDSPYNIPATWTMSNEKATGNGFAFSKLQDWLPKLIENLAVQL
ncbi:NAD-dependent epimerase/dehydratase family protein [Sediminibacillus dalangtanensis]|uniref:NAD-dependent epimerase/dehydratase family protein n=1 Tax=Sediminibacillus dalangtanensis TaxID=2729421 RepID=A0ABX7W0M0_9BACI|nr:NAD-dependent epimerase/dehydratase family protein [Sediminibacillus dalangtanensis]QTN00737.1 NAD-dependent epimerase/dehydratase family protein [Sediminibacillus dalangtanensis]